MTRRGRPIGPVAALLGVMMLSPAGPHASQEPAAPRILLDQPARAVEYQLGRLTNDELARVERKDSDVKYRPVYFALLTRKGLTKELRDEALSALAKIDRVSQAQVLLDALAKIPPEDALPADKLVAMLLGLPADMLRQQRELLTRAIDTSSQPFVLRAAYGGLMAADGNPDTAWQTAVKHEGHLVELLRAVPQLPSGGPADALRDKLLTSIAALLGGTPEANLRAAAVTALGATRRDAATFALLAQEITKPAAGGGAPARAAAVSALLSFPETVRPAGDIEPVARALVSMVRDAPLDQRTDLPILQAVELGDRLAGALPEATRLAVRRDLRALGVRVVRIETKREQMLFDLNWFVAEGGKPVQIVLSNPDGMPHNLVVIKPGSLQEVAAAATAMPLPTDPDVKAYVPDNPAVLQATKLLNEGETAQLSFTAPAQPGEYVFLCSFPGHWVRMYGVMLVVDSLEAWEARPTTPTDPLTNKPFGSQRK